MFQRQAIDWPKTFQRRMFFTIFRQTRLEGGRGGKAAQRAFSNFGSYCFADKFRSYS